ncbi:ATP-dependent DNA ligase LigD phosphoesterase module /ATP-dependent DNA ligase LigD polymerase module [Tistlia consotensis]|uniref:DNA ligase (ATP) n=1 Tax=Tistlia consotensis USBA 355 TaxID=560819 RepID=A0A1Y6CPF6_9PROT|nr:DNA ligase D [Tistlia consotensis]SMF80365.1 ATP-dependent DNA ligase LigD phosphoesterase module /ATP-dependent DNA ligase LigD polymerase module [Tistlia consotensis USBA 355]SNR62600.1 ATP-dependent DNA ligase LigD phosphoesterase module /ATP-dependent DNA ligase LigD polymerase module [Tistlia consotensis]
MAGLATYRRKRDFSKTGEPAGRKSRRQERFFIVQKHDASRLHYDFRLAIGGVLVSWAVTKGPSLDPSDKRLAVRTEDHPLDYAGFEGTIPEGQYGGGTVMLWDRGAFEAEGDPAEGVEAGRLKLVLHGERLKGGFALVRMRPRKGETRENWLLIKEKDEAVDRRRNLGRIDESVASGRSMAEISKEQPAARFRKGGKTGQKAGRPPACAGPQLATLVEDTPEGEGWLFETKFDGYRMLAACDGTAVRCHTRSGADWTDRFGPIAEALAELGLSESLLDGEVVVADAKGRSDFGALQRALKADPARLSYFVFDALRLDGEDLTGLPLRERKARLDEALEGVKRPLRLAAWIEGDGARAAAAACRQGQEGIVAKRADAPYRSRRTRDWLKIKCVKRQEFVVGGWSRSNRSRPFSSLLLGLHEPDGLHYAGRVGTGYDEAQLESLSKKLKRLSRKTPPFASLPSGIRRGARWVTPELVAEVRYSELTRDGLVRHAVFEGLREDKAAEEVGPERPAPPESKTKGEGEDDMVEIAGVTLSHPERVLFASMGVTKRALAEYFEAVAEAMLPQLQGRPVSLVRCPDGSRKECFFQKHAGPSLPEAIGRVSIAEKNGGRKDYLLIESTAALVGCAQIGALELHLWGSRRDRIERPDRLVLDLDPGEGVGFAAVRRAAVELAGILREAGLESAPLLTGGKGLHLVVALERRQDWPALAGFAKAFAGRMAELDPARFVATLSKARRDGRIFIDHFRNQRGATAICPFSPRAREGAPVAVPVSWSELEGIERANAFSLKAVRDDLAARQRAWRGIPGRQRLTAAGAARIGLALEEG